LGPFRLKDRLKEGEIDLEATAEAEVKKLVEKPLLNNYTQ
jgi:hypothetical protein